MTERSIFLAALDIADAAERTAFLDLACGADAALKRRVECLLRAHFPDDSFLEKPPPGVATTADVSADQAAVIGPYKLLQQIGEGGMGVVFMAEQQQPVRRMVAVKVIKPGMNTKQVVARFEAERQALALMDHPSIARVFDGGTTDDGRPFFVMELVHGVPITEFCDANRLSPRQRLELFVQVCQAIQHAHQKGIIHRDIKPSNVLVTLYDDRPVPKVIDFGVAKALDRRLTEKTLYTRFGTLIGTFEYMSPEQAEMNALGVDTRGDIFSLGVLLYELLTGTTPLERSRLREAGYGEILRLIREEDPPRPSLRLSTSGSLAKVAAARKTDAAGLSRLLRGELDWVVMRCLEKDRTRRYDTASGLARDVERYLRDEPVEARPATAWYRFRKMARRNRAALVTVALVGLALVVGAGVSVWQAVRATRAESEAVLERERAEQTAVTVQIAYNFIQNDLLDPDELVAFGGRDARLRPALDHAVRRLRQRPPEQPAAESMICFFLGRSYLFLGDPDAALPLLERALDLGRRVKGESHPDNIVMMVHLAAARSDRDEPDRAEALLVDALRLARRDLEEAEPAAVLPLRELAEFYRLRGRHDRAEPLAAQSLEMYVRAGLGEQVGAMQARWTLARIYAARQKFSEAEPLLERVWAFRRQEHGPEHPLTLDVMHELGHVRQQGGRLSEATTVLREALEGRRRVLGQDHPDTADTLVTLGAGLARQGEHEEAQRLLREALPLHEKLHPEGYQTFVCRHLLGASLLARKNYAEAEPLLLAAYQGMAEWRRTHPDSSSFDPGETARQIAECYDGLDAPEKAAEWRRNLNVMRHGRP